MLKVIIFDLDGTLVNTDKTIFHTWEELFLLYKPKDYVINVDDVLATSGPPLMESIKKLFPEKDPEFINKEYIKRTKKYYEKYAEIYDGSIKALKTFKFNGYKIALVTNKYRPQTEWVLNRFNIAQYFDYVVSGSDVKNLKPHKEPYEKVLNYFNITNKEAISIGDTKYDFLGSNELNIKCFIMSLRSKKLELDFKPYKVLNNYDELIKEVELYGNN